MSSKKLLIAGPCVVESYEHLFGVAEKLAGLTKAAGIDWVLKASYDKANRSDIVSYRGPGIERGISILNRVKRNLDCRITSDFHSVEELRYYGSTVDIVQIPAFLCRQTDILLAAAGIGRVVNVKKGQFISPGGVSDIVHKLRAGGAGDVFVTERGSQFGYGDVVVDFRRFKPDSDWVDVLDVTHSVNDWRDSLNLMKAGLGVGLTAFFMEVGSTLCDEKRSIPLDEVERFIECLSK